ncbi:MAG: phosphonate ABC transporter, permease protein PhnE [Candidatus Poseidoniaceae archaeon]|jgi:phosphonate ABC transporter permease subunit PhnE|nr:phosphonate ABC transporter, permease protein PhnE [Candidatus Poseidoniaceae archaeon]
MRRHHFIIAILALILLSWMTFLDVVGNDWFRLEGSWDNLVIFFSESIWPLDWSVLDASPPCDGAEGFFCSPAYTGIVETLKMAFVATILGFIIALPLSTIAASNLSPTWIAIPIRIFLSAMRSLPSIIWAIFLLIFIGIGPVAGILAMALYTIGYLGKLQYESIEGIQNAPLEAAIAMGLKRSEVAVHVAIPEAANHLISQLMFMFEYNVRHGTVLGIVGAGGIGYHINNQLKFLAYDKAVALLVVVFVVVVAIDMLSMYIRSFVTEEGDVKRPSWGTIFLPAGMAARHHHKSRKEHQEEEE